MKNTPLMFARSLQIALVELGQLRTHEQVDQHHLVNLVDEIRSDRVLKFAIAVDKSTRIILDGSHRFHALRELGCSRIPVVFVDLHAHEITVGSWKQNWQVTKEMIIEAGLSRRLLPPKTSKHMISINGNRHQIFAIEKEVNLPLRKLRIHE